MNRDCSAAIQTSLGRPCLAAAAKGGHRPSNGADCLPAAPHHEDYLELTKLDLSQRRLESELMDQPGLDAQVHRQALRALQRINWLSRSAQIVWPDVRQTASAIRGRPCRVLDIASGGGDVAMALAKRCQASSLAVHITGLDISPTAVAHARDCAEQQKIAGVAFEQHDVFRDPLPEGYDVVMCSLFLHHLARDQAVELLGKMAHAASDRVLVNDLRRTRLGYALAWLGGRLLTRSPIVHVDGPMSVAAAFTCQEALELAGEAGLSGATCCRRWPQRFLLTWRKQP
jgi:2-polyprenyl-3-methyl-5-hydroxy-6-metoxy-1,4-benzoquinol methylase